ncbi:MAG: DJ-1/PfpI family protein [Chloroflexota bacterium]
MTTDNSLPHLKSNCTFILWGDDFDEESASIFATEFRRIGLRVKIVGVNGPSASGAHGLTIRPDMTLGDALPLAPSSSCIILPCGLGTIRRIQEDPRVLHFLQTAAENCAQFIGSQEQLLKQSALEQLNNGTSRWDFYQHEENLIEFAIKKASKLMNHLIG